MTHQHTWAWRPRLFRCFVTNQYHANRDEYDGAGQRQPNTFEQYASANLAQLKRDFKLHKQELLRDGRVQRWRSEWGLAAAALLRSC